MSSFDDIKREIIEHRPAPVYFLHGEEAYFTDRLVELFENYLPEEERAFNFYNLYALEQEPENIMELARRYPLMADKTVIIVKETQAAKGGAGKWINKLAKYALNPSPTTLLVIVARGSKVACKEFTDALKKSKGVVFESSKIKDNQVSSAVVSMLKDVSLKYDAKAIAMIVENIGNNLSKIYNEIDKLRMVLPEGATVTPEVVEKNVGISREYNNFELVKALAYRNSTKALKIVTHFNLSQKDNPWVLTLSAIFSHFANALIAFYTDRTDRAIMNALDLRNTYALADYKTTMSNYSPSQIIEVIGLLREADAFGKGNGSRLPVERIMENLIFKILMTDGKLK